MPTNEGTYYTVTVSNLTLDQLELTAGILSYLEVAAFEEQETSIHIHSDDKDFMTTLPTHLLNMCSWLQPDQISLSDHDKVNWNHVWESNFSPIKVDDFCLIKASFHEESADQFKHVITIDPEMAFGTGHHETTYTMIQMMSRLDMRGLSVFDYGCGTAILAILAEQMGADKVDAIDYDPIAIECAVKCLETNNCSKIHCTTATLDAFQKKVYDVILANINRNVLLDTASGIHSRQVPGGQLLLSGLLLEDIDLVQATYTKLGYQLIDKLERGEWACLYLTL